jgi:hypothetical protein
MTERWLPAVGWPRYKVSSLGRVVREQYVDIVSKTWKQKSLKVSSRYVSMMANKLLPGEAIAPLPKEYTR